MQTREYKINLYPTHVEISDELKQDGKNYKKHKATCLKNKLKRKKRK